MAGFSISQNPSVSARVAKPKAVNPNGGKSVIARPPRLKGGPKAANTRDYAKPEVAAEQPPMFGGGFGTTGTTGET